MLSDRSGRPTSGAKSSGAHLTRAPARLPTTHCSAASRPEAEVGSPYLSHRWVPQSHPGTGS